MVLVRAVRGFSGNGKSGPYFKLVLNDLIRNRSRIILTIIALTTGVALFLLSFHLKASLQQTVMTERNKQLHDIEIYLDDDYSSEKLAESLNKLEGVDEVAFLKETSFFLQVNGEITTDEYQITALADAPAP